MNSDDVYLTRHGARIDTQDPSWLQKSTHNRSEDPHLSPAGQTSAVELAQAFTRLQHQSGVQLAHIISSPYIRCVETAHVVAEAMGVDVKIEPGIAEVNSSRTKQFLDATDLKAQFPLIETSYSPVLKYNDLSIEYSDGACAQRSADAALKVRENLDGTILFVGHGASCLGIARAFGHGGYVGYSSLTHFVKRDGKWKLDGLFGDVAHLSDKKTSLDSAW